MHKLLIVDDNENNRDVLHDALDSKDYELFEAEDGKAALEQVAKIEPDLILLDIEMPILDGVSTLKKLKSQDETRQIPVIMVTALNTDSQIATCLDNGAIDHIVKPFSNMVVRARVRAALRSAATAVVDSAPVQSRGKVITVMGVKGGVGTTTVALNIAAAVVKQGKRAIACELRHRVGSMAAQLGTSKALSLSVLLDEDSGRIDNQKLSDCLVSHTSGLKLLLGPQSLDPVTITAEQVETILTALSAMADVTVFDVTTSFTDATSFLFRQSDVILLVVELEPTAQAAAKLCAEKLDTMGIGRSGIGVIAVNRAPTAIPFSPNDLRVSLDCKIVGVVPSDPDACMAAIRAGNTVINSYPESSVAAAFTAIANRVTAQDIAELKF